MRADNGKNECKIEILKGDKAALLKSLKDYNKDCSKSCTAKRKLENEKNQWNMN